MSNVRQTIHVRRLQLMGRTLGQLMTTPMKMRCDQLTRLPLPPGKVLFLGDSITEQGMWHEWLPDLPSINRGIGGDTVLGVRERLDNAVNEPTVISLLVGTNDLSGLGKSTKPTHIAAQFEGLVSELRRGAPSAALIINSVMPRTPGFAPTIRELNTLYADIAARNVATYLDLWPTLVGFEGELRRGFTADNLHLNGTGYQAWIRVLEPEIKRALAGETPTR